MRSITALRMEQQWKTPGFPTKIPWRISGTFQQFKASHIHLRAGGGWLEFFGPFMWEHSNISHLDQKSISNATSWFKDSYCSLNLQLLCCNERFLLGFSVGVSNQSEEILPQNLTWNLKMMVSKRNLHFQGLLFRFHVKFQGCTLLVRDSFQISFTTGADVHIPPRAPPPTCMRKIRLVKAIELISATWKNPTKIQVTRNSNLRGNFPFCPSFLEKSHEKIQLLDLPKWGGIIQDQFNTQYHEDGPSIFHCFHRSDRHPTKTTSLFCFFNR